MKKLLLKSLLSVSLLCLLLSFSHTPRAYAQLAGCAQIPVGTPPVNQQIPAGCESTGGDAAGQAVVALARQHLAGSYVWGGPSPRSWPAWDPNTGNAPTHFDCSAFTGWSWYWGTNRKVDLPLTSDTIFQNYAKMSTSAITFTRAVGTTAGIKPGDLVMFGTVASTVHVGIYEGTGACGANDCFLEWYSSGQPGRSNSLAKEGSWYVGYVHIAVH